jgi:hypothetical protein
MPRITRRKKNRRAGYNKAQIAQLLHGVAVSPSSAFGALHKGMADMNAMRAAWDELRDELIDEWVSQHPFSRPLGWLLFDATEPRIRVIGEQRIEAMEAAAKRNLGDGFRQCFFKSLNTRLGYEDTRGDEGAWESEEQYLTRIGALLPAELELIG